MYRFILKLFPFLGYSSYFIYSENTDIILYLFLTGSGLTIILLIETLLKLLICVYFYIFIFFNRVKLILFWNFFGFLKLIIKTLKISRSNAIKTTVSWTKYKRMRLRVGYINAQFRTDVYNMQRKTIYPKGYNIYNTNKRL